MQEANGFPSRHLLIYVLCRVRIWRVDSYTEFVIWFLKLCYN